VPNTLKACQVLTRRYGRIVRLEGRFVKPPVNTLPAYEGVEPDELSVDRDHDVAMAASDVSPDPVSDSNQRASVGLEASVAHEGSSRPPMGRSPILSRQATAGDRERSRHQPHEPLGEPDRVAIPRVGAERAAAEEPDGLPGQDGPVTADELPRLLEPVAFDGPVDQSSR